MPDEDKMPAEQMEDLGTAFGDFIAKGFEPEVEEEEGETGEQSRQADDEVEEDREADTLEEDDENAEDDATDDDTDDEDEDELEADEDDDAEDNPDDATVEIDGQEVTLSELKQGYRRQSDYTVKTEALAQERAKVEQASAAVVQTQQQLGAINATMLGFLQKILPEEPTLELYHTDAVAYQDQQVKREHVLREMQGVRQLIDQSMAEENNKIQATQQEAIQNSAKALTEARPFIKDPERRKQYFDDLTQGAQKYYNIPAETVLASTDHNVFLVLEDAVRYRKAKEKAPKVKKKVTERRKPVMKSGNRNRGQASSAVGRAKRQVDQAAKSGRVQDASSVLGALLIAED